MKKPIPPDFPETAPNRRTEELVWMYRVSKTTIQKWRRILGIPPPRPTKYMTNHYRGDNAAQIACCLSCGRYRCTGNCEAVRLAANNRKTARKQSRAR